MARQIGFVLGISLLGSPVGYAAAHAGFQRVWWALAAVAVVAAAAALGMTPRTAPAPATRAA